MGMRKRNQGTHGEGWKGIKRGRKEGNEGERERGREGGREGEGGRN